MRCTYMYIQRHARPRLLLLSAIAIFLGYLFILFLSVYYTWSAHVHRTHPAQGYYYIANTQL